MSFQFYTLHAHLFILKAYILTILHRKNMQFLNEKFNTHGAPPSPTKSVIPFVTFRSKLPELSVLSVVFMYSTLVPDYDFLLVVSCT